MENKKLGVAVLVFGLLVINLAIYLFFAIVIILFETLPSNPQSSCAGRLPAGASDTSTPNNIRIAYFSISTFIALVWAALFAIFGGLVYIKILSLKSAAIMKSGQRVFFFFSIILEVTFYPNRFYLWGVFALWLSWRIAFSC
mgnify:FL=1